MHVQFLGVSIGLRSPRTPYELQRMCIAEQILVHIVVLAITYIQSPFFGIETDQHSTIPLKSAHIRDLGGLPC